MEYDEAVTRAAGGLCAVLFMFAFGVFAFAGVAIALGPLDPSGPENMAVLRWVVLGFPLLELPAIALLWAQFSRRIADADDWQSRLVALRGRTIVIAALLEAPALLAGVVILLTGFSWQALPALGMFLIGLGLLLPLKGRIVKAIGREDGGMHDEYS
ncbi:MAG: hypothetical protein KDB68_12125 [Planctomycetes bacterium]|nr:hypothetical protein [Planctomycetota bacterium]MCA8945635.1 hypothetical protein [Planctomycetota bacterium]